MAKGWRLYADYERNDFGRVVRSVLGPSNRGASWLAAAARLNKGTISQILNGRRSCPLDLRRRIVETVGRLVSDEDTVAQLLRSAGLRSEEENLVGAHGGESTSSLPGRSGMPATITVGDRDEGIGALIDGVRFRHELGRVSSARESFTSAARIGAANGHPRLEARAILNLAYLDFEIAKLGQAADAARSAAQAAITAGLWNMAAEATQLLGRIDLRQEDYEGARTGFRNSNALLGRLGSAGLDVLSRWPHKLPRVGHSFVISEEVDVPEVVLNAGNLHFLGKTDLCQVEHDALPLGFLREAMLTSGSRYLAEAHDLDHRSDTGHHLGFDLVMRSRIFEQLGDLYEARRCLDAARSYLGRGAGKREWLLMRANLTAGAGMRFGQAMHDVEESTAAGGLMPSALAEIYELRRSLYCIYRPKAWKQHAFRNGLAAFSLQPFPSYARRFKEATRILQEDLGDPAKLRRVVIGTTEELLAFGGGFAPVGDLVRRLGAAEWNRVRQNTRQAVAIAVRSHF